LVDWLLAVPAGQRAQVEGFWKTDPKAHAEQEEAPEADTVAGGQGRQLEKLTEKNPAWQATQTVEPAEGAVPLGQVLPDAMQLGEPV
jgi:hypothetical protein